MGDADGGMGMAVRTSVPALTEAVENEMLSLPAQLHMYFKIHWNATRCPKRQESISTK